MFVRSMRPSLALLTSGFTGLCLTLCASASPARADSRSGVERAAVPEGAIKHVLVIDLENENFSTTFSPSSPATYLNGTLLKQGQLITNYFATSHVSLGNYLAQVSGQAPTPAQNNDCIDLATLSHPPLAGGFTNVLPGNDAADQASFPGQVVGDGCVFPAPTKTSKGARTIGDQLDALRGDDEAGHGLRWRSYAEDMGLDSARDYGTPDPLGGTSCAHPPINGVDHSNSAAANDQYATRHNPFVYFHSVIDDQTRCDAHVVSLGKVEVGSNGSADRFSGHLYEDLKKVETTPNFMFVSPNLCNDAHDATCVGLNTEGGHEGGLVAADKWLKHWMPLLFASPAYQSGKMLIVLTFDEAGFSDSRACPALDQSTCGSPVGPNVSNPGYSPILGMFHFQTAPSATYQYAGGGQIGAVVFNKRYVTPGSVNSTGYYNHFSALRSYEDLLGVTRGGDDGLGHLGYAAKAGLRPFGKDVFSRPINDAHDSEH
jgi:hypothetical protein